MLLYEKELKIVKSKIKKIIILLISLFVFSLVYYVYSVFLWNSKDFIQKKLLGINKMAEVNNNYDIGDVNEIIVKFDISFTESESFKNLQTKPYKNLSDDKPGRKNPFELYNKAQ